MDEAPSTSVAAAALALERAIHVALQMDSVALARIGALSGEIIELCSHVPRWRLFLVPNAAGLQIKTWHEGPVTCAVSGDASDFVAVFTAEDKPGALVNGNLKIHGDSNVLLELGNALSTLDLDWESRLALLLGDIPAHQIGRLLRGSLEWGRGAGDSLLRHIEEFIHEEARLAPPRLEVEDFFADLRMLAQDSARAEARVRRMARRIAALRDRSSDASRNLRG
jgi:ubiquinone biosynthesis accessory factor UbiJ